MQHHPVFAAVQTLDDLRLFMGCVQKVFRGEIDIAGFEAAERNGGFGGLRNNFV